MTTKDTTNPMGDQERNNLLFHMGVVVAHILRLRLDEVERVNKLFFGILLLNMRERLPSDELVGEMGEWFEKGIAFYWGDEMQARAAIVERMVDEMDFTLPKEG